MSFRKSFFIALLISAFPAITQGATLPTCTKEQMRLLYSSSANCLNTITTSTASLYVCCPVCTASSATTPACPNLNWLYNSLTELCERLSEPSEDDTGYMEETFGTCEPTSSGLEIKTIYYSKEYVTPDNTTTCLHQFQEENPELDPSLPTAPEIKQ